MIDELTEEELAVFKRGRNARTNSTPKNASSSDYHMATGLEALWGYLYLKGDTDRLLELFEKSAVIEKRNKTGINKSPF